MAFYIGFYAYAIIVHTRADQLLPQLLIEQFDTFPIQCRHIEHEGYSRKKHRGWGGGIQFPQTPTTYVIRKVRKPTTHRIQNKGKNTDGRSFSSQTGCLYQTVASRHAHLCNELPNSPAACSRSLLWTQGV